MLAVSLAGLLFVATHIGLSSTTLRAKLVALLGERGFLAVYSGLALLTLGNLVWLYGEVPRYEYLWLPDPRLNWIPKVVMPFAFVLAAGALMVRNPTAIGAQVGLLDRPVRGMLRITRHPLQWAIALWASTHIAANGDSVSVAFFASFAALAVVGSLLIDRKRAAAWGDAWQPFAASTSNLPFAAIAEGRNRFAGRELLGPAIVGLVLYAVVLWYHQWVSGVRII